MEREARDTEVCIRIGEFLDSYVSGEASDGESKEVESHIATCAGCARAVEASMRLRRAVRGAVERADGAPAEIRNRIRARVREEAPAPHTAWMACAAAAALVVVALGGWAVLRDGGDGAVARTTSAEDAAFLEVGLKHHVHCVGANPPGAGAPDAAALDANLGPEYSGLVAVVSEHVPRGLTRADAHRCSSNGRRFVHVVLRGDNGLVSLLVTAGDAATRPREDGADGGVEVAGLNIHSTSEDGLGVSGFATTDDVVFVVSGVADAPAPQLASAIAPSVRDFLTTRRE